MIVEKSSPATSHRKGSLGYFFFAAYALTWVLLAPFFYLLNVTYGGEMQPWMWAVVPFALLGGWGPSLAAVIVTARAEGGPAARSLLGSLFRWRVPVRWYLIVFAFPPVVTAVSVLLAGRGFDEFLYFDPITALTAIPAAYLLALPFGPLGEELGWRGYALPRLLPRYGAVWASLMLGIVWTFWHVPMMLWSPGAAIPSVMGLSVVSVSVFLVQIISETVLMTLVFLRTNGSLLLAVLAHLCLNTSEAVVYGGLPEPAAAHQRTVYLINVALLAVVALVTMFYLSSTRKSGAAE